MRRTVPSIILILFLWPGAAWADPPRVVASIKPVHSLIAGVMAGIGNPALLVPDAASPRTYSLRPSDSRALARADFVFWVGPGMERTLAKPLAALAGGAEIIELDRATGVTVLPRRRGRPWTPGPDSPPGVPYPDGHLWLDPGNARAIVRLAADSFARRDPANAARYQANAADLETRLAALDNELRAQFFPLAGQPFLVSRDAYQYLERRYALAAIGAIPLDPDRPPAAGRIPEIRARIRASGARCIFGDPDTRPSLLIAVTEGTGVRTGTLDALGVNMTPGPALYFAVLRGIARALSDCLVR
jgi:zinc transport system substrate-binding protein